MTRTPTEIVVYWDWQDRNDEGWAYRLRDFDGDIETGSLELGADDDIERAIEDAVSLSGLELELDDFAIEPKMDGGFAIWNTTAGGLDV